MVNICATHAAANDLLFSAYNDPLKSKTITIAFNCNKEQLGNIMLNNDPLPWKVFSKHIGCSLHEDGNMEHDMSIKRATFISDCMNLNNQFSFLKPEDQIRLMYLYNSHFSGSSTWQFDSGPFRKLVNSWNVNIKTVYELPYGTHNFLLEELTGGRHARTMIYKRFISFLSSVATNRRRALSSLLDSVKSSCLSLTGANIRQVLLHTGISVEPGVTNGAVLNNFRLYETPVNQEWKFGLLKSLLAIRDEEWSLEFDEETEQFASKEINDLIVNVCEN